MRDNKQNSRFQLGSGVFECIICHRKTRGGAHYDCASVRQCPECWDIGGLENEIADSEEGSTAAAEAEIQRLKAIIISKGGKLS